MNILRPTVKVLEDTGTALLDSLADIGEALLCIPSEIGKVFVKTSDTFIAKKTYYVCDRCGKFELKDKDFHYHEEPSNKSRSIRVKLCKDCDRESHMLTMINREF